MVQNIFTLLLLVFFMNTGTALSSVSQGRRATRVPSLLRVDSSPESLVVTMQDGNGGVTVIHSVVAGSRQPEVAGRPKGHESGGFLQWLREMTAHFIAGLLEHIVLATCSTLGLAGLVGALVHHRHTRRRAPEGEANDREGHRAE